MRWYAYWRNNKDEVMGFIKDCDDPNDDGAGSPAKSWNTEAHAIEEMNGHLLFNAMEFIKL